MRRPASAVPTQESNHDHLADALKIALHRFESADAGNERIAVGIGLPSRLPQRSSVLVASLAQQQRMHDHVGPRADAGVQRAVIAHDRARVKPDSVRCTVNRVARQCEQALLGSPVDQEARQRTMESTSSTFSPFPRFAWKGEVCDGGMRKIRYDHCTGTAPLTRWLSASRHGL